jgi:hypothetical protein
MRRRLMTFAAALLAAGFSPAALAAGTGSRAIDKDRARGATMERVDGIAVRIEDDIIMESEVRELEKFQQLVDGKRKPREEVLRELEDQWVIRGEAKTSKFPSPPSEEVDRAYSSLVSQYGSPEEFQKQLESVGLTEKEVRRLLADQLYFARFLDYRFRPAAQVDDAQVDAYYRDEFVPALSAKGQTAPPLEEVEDRIREVLIERAITERAEKWLDETRQQLRIEIPEGGGGT